jgi:hypothetical protein
LGLLGVERDFLENSTAVDEVCFRGCLTETVDRDDFVLFLMVWTNCDEIIGLAWLELDMGDVSLELEPNSEPL